MASILLTNAVAILAMMTMLWGVSLVLKDASIVDIFWGAGFAVVAWVTFFSADGESARMVLLLTLTTIWGLRLAVYLGWRNIGKAEDYRYRAMRKRLGSRFPLASLFTVFMLQGLLMWIVSLPVQAGQNTEGGLNGFDIAGIAFWAVGLFFETVGDWQLARFKADPTNSGRVMDKGLWRYTRHPNYFGDFMVWWGIFLVAIATGESLWTVVGPIVMSILLIRVSGAALLENSLRKRRDGYEEYISRTSAFFPRSPRQV